MEISEDIVEESCNNDVAYYFEEIQRDLPKDSLQLKGDPKLSVYPNQRYLGEQLFERIKKAFEIHKQDFTQFKTMDFQIYTPSKNLLEKQTLGRIFKTDGILPDHIARLINTKDEEEAMNYVKKRVLKLNTKEEYLKRFDEIVSEVENNPTHLHINIFDEAHHSATSKPTQMGSNMSATPKKSETEGSSYEIFANKWNSDDHPNVINLMVSATPWNLQTVQTRFEGTEVGYKNGQLDIVGGMSSCREFKKKFKLYEMKWSESYNKAFQEGKEVHLMALTSEPSYQWLRVNKITKEIIGTEDKMEASTFIIQGDREKHLCIRDKETNLFWTWSAKTSLQDISILEPENSTSLFQKFDVTTTYGEGLIRFNGYNNENRILRFIDGKLCTTDTRSGVVEEYPECPESPCNDTFLIFPKSTPSEPKFYLSLNHIVNSLRCENEEDQLIRNDELSNKLFNKCQRGLDNVKEKDDEILCVQISCYCLAILLKGSFCDFVKDNTSVSELIKEVRMKQRRLIDDLHHSKEHNTRHRPIKPEQYKGFLNSLKDILDKTYVKKIPKKDIPFSVVVLISMLNIDEESDPNVDLNQYERTKQEFVDEIYSYLGATGTIVNDCLTPFSSNSDSGHMAIIRVKKKEGGRMFKQSLYIAKLISKLYKLEIIQDFHGNTTTLTQHFIEAQKAAKATKSSEALRIKRRIQPHQCQKLNSKGKQACKCTKYQPKEDAEYNLECADCNHIHLVFSSYEDLINLPCLLILVNNGRMGDTFPDSLICMDDRAYNLTKGRSKTYLSPFAQEKGRLCRYTSLDEKWPYVYVGKGLYEQLKDALKHGCSYYKAFIPDKIDEKVVFNKTRHRLEPRNKHADEFIDKSKKRNNHFLLNAEPQCGKTGVYLCLITLFRLFVNNEQVEIDDFSDDEDFSEDSDIETVFDSRVNDEKDVDIFLSTVPYWKTIKELDELPTEIPNNSKYGSYSYPMDSPPYLPKRKDRSKVQRPLKTENVKHYIATHKFSHKCETCANKSGFVEEDMKLEVSECSGDVWGNFPNEEHYDNLFLHREVSDSNLIHIMTPSFGRASAARLNWNHLMETKDKVVKPFIHVVFVRPDQYKEYNRKWAGQLAIVKLPQKINNIEETVYNGGIGFVRRFIQLFAKEFKINYFFMADDTILYLKQGMSTNRNSGLQMEHITMLTLWEHLSKLGSFFKQVPEEHRNFQRHISCDPQSVNIAAYSGPFDTFGIIGFRKMRRTNRKFKSYFAKRHVCSLMFLNNKVLMERNVLFRPWMAKEDLVFCNDADAKGLTVLKFKLFEIFKVNIRSDFENELYIWTDKDSVTNESNQQLEKSAVIRKITSYIHSLRIKCTRKNEIPDIPLNDVIECKKEGNSTALYLLRDLETFGNILRSRKRSGSKSPEDNTIVIEIVNISSLKNLKGIENWLKRQGVTNFSLDVMSCVKPKMAGDFVVIRITPIEKTLSAKSISPKKQSMYDDQAQPIAGPSNANSSSTTTPIKKIDSKDLSDAISKLASSVRNLSRASIIKPEEASSAGENTSSDSTTLITTSENQEMSPKRRMIMVESPEKKIKLEDRITQEISSEELESQVPEGYIIVRRNGKFPYDQVKSDNWVLVNKKALAKVCDENPETIQIEDLFRTPQAQVSRETVKKIEKIEAQTKFDSH